jgi:hypothetical protein
MPALLIDENTAREITRLSQWSRSVRGANVTNRPESLVINQLPTPARRPEESSGLSLVLVTSAASAGGLYRGKTTSPKSNAINQAASTIDLADYFDVAATEDCFVENTMESGNSSHLLLAQGSAWVLAFQIGATANGMPLYLVSMAGEFWKTIFDGSNCLVSRHTVNGDLQSGDDDELICFLPCSGGGSASPSLSDDSFSF